ncbi:hypothetical protein [Romboutsia sp.]|uniref:hypothetical protein n=1 Tax=Romboutsia sp. TaxID=1965302 RepID=UPI003F329C87
MKKYTLLIAMVITLCVVVVSIINKPYKNTDKYLEKNYSNLDLQDEESFDGLDILSQDIKDKKIILTGEEHNLSDNHIMSLKLIKYFQKEVGVNYLLEEMGTADAYFLNKYLESGNEDILKEYFNIYKNQKLYTEERYNEYVEIYKFNKTLPIDKRIKIVGTDIESKATYYYLIDTIKNEDMLTDELKTLINELKEFDYYTKISYRNILNTLEELKKDVDSNEDKYKSIFKEDFNEFKFVIKNMIDFSNVCASEDNYTNLRDKYIYENFKIIDSNLKDAVYFGQWGGAHIFQETVYNNINQSYMDYFASLLNKDEKYKGKILSINYAYYFEKSTFDHNGYSVNEDLFKEYINLKSKATIFRLNSRKSPFKEKSINPFDTNLVDYKDKPITDYIQYIILIRNSEKSKVVM